MPPTNQLSPALRKNTDEKLVEWLLDSDPSIRWQVKKDLLHAPEEDVKAERAKVETTGWGRKILSQQAADGKWGGVAWNHGWNSTMHALFQLRELGLEPSSESAKKAILLVREKVTWAGCGPEECAANPFFTGEVEPCINGQVCAAGAYFGVLEVRPLINLLLSEQLEDGGWNCEAEFGSKRSSFNTTICVLEALLQFEQTCGSDVEVTAARKKGEEYLLERKIFHKLSTGEVIEKDRKAYGNYFIRFASPSWWHYDVLRALDYLRAAEAKADDPRLEPAIKLIESKRNPEDGRWPVEVRLAGEELADVEVAEGQPSRWVTLRALRVLDWYYGKTQLPA